MAAADPASDESANSADNAAEAVKCLKVVLEGGLQGGSDDNLLNTLQALKTLGSLSLRVISETGIGKVVAQLAREPKLGEPVRAAARGIVVQWKDQLSQKKTEREASATATPTAPTAPATQTAALVTPATAAQPVAAQLPDQPAGARWTPPVPKATLLVPAVATARAGAAASKAASAAPQTALPAPTATLRAAAAESSAPAAEDFEEPEPPSKEDILAKEVATAVAGVRTEYECGVAVFTGVLEIKSLFRRILAPFRKIRSRAEADERLLKAIAARLPDSEGIASQWRSGAASDAEVAKLLKELPKSDPKAVASAQAAAASTATKNVRRQSKVDAPPNKAAADEDEDEEDEEEDGPAKKSKASGKAAGKTLLKRPASAWKGALAFKKTKLGG